MGRTEHTVQGFLSCCQSLSYDIPRGLFAVLDVQKTHPDDAESYSEEAHLTGYDWLRRLPD